MQLQRKIPTQRKVIIGKGGTTEYAWHHLKKVPPCLDCDDYQNSGWSCVPGTGDYHNADGQDEETDVSICDSWPEYDFPVAGVDDYENADVQPRGGGNPGDCI